LVFMVNSGFTGAITGGRKCWLRRARAAADSGIFEQSKSRQGSWTMKLSRIGRLEFIRVVWTAPVAPHLATNGGHAATSAQLSMEVCL